MVFLSESALKSLWTREYPQRLIGDQAYDSDALDERLSECYGIEMIAAHKRNRQRHHTQDGRVLRRAKRRWRVERLFA